ncbi:hypothetical protein F5Y15DRAFT_277383 [Xylariaceae sp. FL0016]|nr:hypothetical protein F5Y15DRAFT_277383 [Xylariaceae sp. FL0016]
MPVLSSSALLTTLVDRADLTNVTNATATPSIPVVCAWPVSGQYGAGSRVLYYVLVAACVLARKAEWLRSACLAAALLIPAVAALHGIVLATLHVNGAVDMDIYGAFQVCAIGILTAPVTVQVSKTYFNDPARNIIFLWTTLLLVGLLSLTVEFYRSQPVPCPIDTLGLGNPTPPLPQGFPYGKALCNLNYCVQGGSLSSPLRQGATDEVFVIPAPSRLTFGAGMSLAAGCCIPAILSLIFTWNKILEINWKERYGNAKSSRDLNEPIAGTNGATEGKMLTVNQRIRDFISTVSFPIFGGVVLVILIFGELNFFSHQLSYQTESITGIGQWGPIVGTVLAAVGSLYVLLAQNLAEVEQESSHSPELGHRCTCSHDHCVPSSRAESIQSDAIESPSRAYLRSNTLTTRDGNSIEMTSTHRSVEGPGLFRTFTSHTTDTGNRRKVATALNRIGDYFGTAAEDRFDMSAFQAGKAQDFPELPGESNRNPQLPQIRKSYNKQRDVDGLVTPRLSRSPSVASKIDVAGDSNARTGSANSNTPHSLTIRSHTLPVERRSSDKFSPSSPTNALDRGRRLRRDTLEVPSPTGHPARQSPPATPENPRCILETPGAPDIIISAEPESHPPSPTPSSPRHDSP